MTAPRWIGKKNWEERIPNKPPISDDCLDPTGDPRVLPPDHPYMSPEDTHQHETKPLWSTTLRTWWAALRPRLQKKCIKSGMGDGKMPHRCRKPTWIFCGESCSTSIPSKS